MISIDGCTFRYQPSVIFQAGGEWKYGREPVIRRMPDGSIFCILCSGGPTEPHDENVILATSSRDEGRTWSPPEVLFQHDTRGVWGTELFTEGDLPCIFVHTLDAASHYLELQTFRSFYSAGSGGWSEPVSLPGGFSGVIVRQGVTLADGSWVLPVYWQEAIGGWNWRKTGKGLLSHPEWRFVSGVLRSADRGESFTLHGNLRTGLNLWEPNVVEIAPDHLVMFLRADGPPVKYRAESRDGGQTWSAPLPSDIPCAGSKITLLKWNNRILMLHNPSTQPGWKYRTSLALWISDDGGLTWPVKLDMVQADEPLVICYPHAFIDEARQCLYVACDTTQTHYFFTVPLADLE